MDQLRSNASSAYHGRGDHVDIVVEEIMVDIMLEIVMDFHVDIQEEDVMADIMREDHGGFFKLKVEPIVRRIITLKIIILIYLGHLHQLLMLLLLQDMTPVVQWSYQPIPGSCTQRSVFSILILEGFTKGIGFYCILNKNRTINNIFIMQIFCFLVYIIDSMKIGPISRTSSPFSNTVHPSILPPLPRRIDSLPKFIGFDTAYPLYLSLI